MEEYNSEQSAEDNEADSLGAKGESDEDESEAEHRGAESQEEEQSSANGEGNDDSIGADRRIWQHSQAQSMPSHKSSSSLEDRETGRTSQHGTKTRSSDERTQFRQHKHQQERRKQRESYHSELENRETESLYTEGVSRMSSANSYATPRSRSSISHRDEDGFSGSLLYEVDLSGLRQRWPSYTQTPTAQELTESLSKDANARLQSTRDIAAKQVQLLNAMMAGVIPIDQNLVLLLSSMGQNGTLSSRQEHAIRLSIRIICRSIKREKQRSAFNKWQRLSTKSAITNVVIVTHSEKKRKIIGKMLQVVAKYIHKRGLANWRASLQAAAIRNFEKETQILKAKSVQLELKVKQLKNKLLLVQVEDERAKKLLEQQLVITSLRRIVKLQQEELARNKEVMNRFIGAPVAISTSASPEATEPEDEEDTQNEKASAEGSKDADGIKQLFQFIASKNDQIETLRCTVEECQRRLSSSSHHWNASIEERGTLITLMGEHRRHWKEKEAVLLHMLSQKDNELAAFRRRLGDLSVRSSDDDFLSQERHRRRLEPQKRVQAAKFLIKVMEDAEHQHRTVTAALQRQIASLRQEVVLLKAKLLESPGADIRRDIKDSSPSVRELKEEIFRLQSQGSVEKVVEAQQLVEIAQLEISEKNQIMTWLEQELSALQAPRSI